MTDPMAALEHKAGMRPPEDAGGVFGEFMNAFEAFKEANDQRLAEIEAKASSDVVTTEKVDRISQALDVQKKALDGILLRQARPALGRGALRRLEI